MKRTAHHKIDLPKASVAMTLYSEPWEWAKAALDSILDQSLEEIEVNVVIDRPDYPYEDRLRDYAAPDQRVTIRALETNGGPAVSANAAMAMGTAPLICIMDGDDIARPQWLEHHVAFMDEHPEVGLSCGWLELFGTHKGQWRYSIGDIRAQFVIDNPLSKPGMMMRREVVEAFDPFFRREYNYAEDYDAWERATRQFHVEILPEVVMDYRTSARQVTSVRSKEMSDTSKRVRLRALNYLLTRHGIDRQLSSPLSSEDLDVLRQLKPLMRRELFIQLVYRMFRSIPGVGLKDYRRLGRMGILSSLSLKYHLKILFVALRGGYWKEDF